MYSVLRTAGYRHIVRVYIIITWTLGYRGAAAAAVRQ